MLLIEWLKRYVEYKADEYAVFHGCEKKNLEAAIIKIENMNDSQNSITVTGHPKLKARMKRLDKC